MVLKSSQIVTKSLQWEPIVTISIRSAILIY